MGRKNDKRTRKTVAFYKVHYGFREPYKVLLDGNFIHASQQAKNQGLQEVLEKVLGGHCKLFTTKCVTQELKSLGEDFRATFLLAKKQQLHKCTHEQPISAADCILQQIGKGNPDHWWVATQDRVLRQTLAQMPGAPCVTTTVHGTHLDPPSDAVKASIREAEQQQLSVPEHELDAVGLKAKGLLRGRRGIFKRNKAKGPNPLAVQKKKKLKVYGTQQQGKQGQQQQGQQQGQQPGEQGQQGKQPADGGASDSAAGAAAAAKKRRRRSKHVAGEQQHKSHAADAAADG